MQNVNKKFRPIRSHYFDCRNITRKSSMPFIGSFSPKILLPTRVTSKSRTLIDNIFTNQLDNSFSGNLDLSFSDHLPQFLVTPINNNSVPKKHNIFIRNMKGFNVDNFKSDIQTANWNELMNCDGGDIDNSFSNFLNKV